MNLGFISRCCDAGTLSAGVFGKETLMENIVAGADVFFVLIGAILVFAMHSGFAFLEVGTVRRKNQVNALVKIIVDFGISTLAYFFIGYLIAYGIGFFESAKVISGAEKGSGHEYGKSGYDLVKFFFLLTFAAAIPAIISGGIAERMKFLPQCLATGLVVAVIYPTFEGMVWGSRFAYQDWVLNIAGAGFHDFAGSVVVHAVGGWIGLAAVLLLGARTGRYRADGSLVAIPPSNIPFLALGSWILCIGWFGFNVMSAQSLEGVSGLVAMNSLLAMAGGILMALFIGRNDPGFIHNGALAGLVAVCAGSDVMHPIGALATGGIAGALFVVAFNLCQMKWKIDDVLGVWPLHGLCGAWGGLACGIFGLEALGGMGGVSFMAQLIGTVTGVIFALIGGTLVYGGLRLVIGLRLDQEDEMRGADLSIHNISAYPEEDLLG
jgi:Amt family ammonium transporter